MSRETEIDAVASLDADRGGSALGDVKSKGSPGAKVFGLLIVVFVLGLLGLVAYKILTREPPDEGTAAATTEAGIRNQMPVLRHTEAPVAPPPPPIVPEVEQEPVEPIQPTAQSAGNRSGSGQPEKTPAQLLRERRLSSDLAGGTASGGDAAEAAPGHSANGQPQAAYGGLLGPQQGQGQQAESMADRLSPLRLAAARAGQVGSMDMLLLQSAMIDCALNTRVDSTVPGMMSCDATRDVYSTNGRTVVLDRGTRFTGRYERGITRGQPRIFVVWERAVTPQGVVINLDSPGTDPLGGSGMSGKVNNHFWKRFGAAILISVFEDAGDYVIASANDGNGTYIGNTTRSASDNSSIVLENSINIPPTLTKLHGDRVNIFVARDLDFSGIYDLRRRH